MVEEKCTCELQFPLVLQWHSSENPIVCSNCNLDSEVENLPIKLKQKMDTWNQGYGDAIREWLDGDEAMVKLNNPVNSLNKLGFSIVAELNMITPTFYWWHLQEDEKLEKCPNCHSALDILLKNGLGITKVCQQCRILIRRR
jgi:hypothetical protein